jgi:hypothetical protein
LGVNQLQIISTQRILFMATAVGAKNSRMLDAVVDLAVVVQSKGQAARRNISALRRDLAEAGLPHSKALDAIEFAMSELVNLNPDRLIFTGSADPGGSSPGGSSPGGSSPGGSSPGGSSPGGSSPGGSSPGGSSPGGSSPGGSSPGGSSPGGSSPGGSSPGGSSPGGSSPGGSSPGGSSPGESRQSLFNAFANLAASVQLVSIVAQRAQAGLEDMRRVSMVSANRLEQDIRTLGALDRRSLVGGGLRPAIAVTSPSADIGKRSLAPRRKG